MNDPPPELESAHLGVWLDRASQRFALRVLALMTQHDGLPLALAHRTTSGSLATATLRVAQHLDANGARLGTLAARAGVSKQAMGQLVQQCERWGLVLREADPRDGRARRIVYTPNGLAWRSAYRHAVAQAEAELRAAVGAQVATVIAIGLEAYAA